MSTPRHLTTKPLQVKRSIIKTAPDLGGFFCGQRDFAPLNNHSPQGMMYKFFATFALE
jgi:hypothetical protein